MYVDVDVDLYCDLCGKPIDDVDNVVCKDCYDSSSKETLEEVREILGDILPYVNEATVMKPVELPGEFAFKLRERIRAILNAK